MATSSVDDGPGDRRAAARTTLLYPIGAYAIVAAAVGAVLLYGHHALGWTDAAGGGRFPVPRGFFGAWYRGDSLWYLDLAENGYSYTPGYQSNVGFWPGLPLLIRGIEVVVRNGPAAGVLASLLSGCASTVLFWWWLQDHLSERARVLALWLLLLYPFSLFLYGPVYAESLALAGVIGAFLLLERGRPALAGLSGALAATARLVGIAAFVALVVGVLDRRRVIGSSDDRGLRRRMNRLEPADSLVLLASGGLLGFFAFLWVRFDDPLTAMKARDVQGWGEELSVSTLLKVEFFHRLVDFDQPYRSLVLFHAVLAVVFLCFVPVVWRRFGSAYGVYTALVVGFPAIVSPHFYAMGRYVLLAFPVFAAAAERLDAERRAVPRAVLAVSGVLLLLTTWLYGDGYFLG